MQATFFASLDLVAHINLAGRVVADQDDGQSGGDAAGFKGRSPLRYFAAQLA
jgi:hypothetical protein